MSASTDRRIAIVAGADDYVGPALAVVMAGRGYDVVLGDASAATVDACRAAGAQVEVVHGTSVHDPACGVVLRDAALAAFGTYHSVFFSSGRIAVGRFMKTGLDDLRAAFEGNVVAPYAFVQAVLPHLVAQGDGQVLVATSATAQHPTPSASLYAGTRAAATVMLQSVGLELAATGVQLNVVGTNFMDFPGFLKGNRAETPEGRARVEALVPMQRLGSMEELAAFCAVFLDASSRFQTGSFVPYAGGWAL